MYYFKDIFIIFSTNKLISESDEAPRRETLQDKNMSRYALPSNYYETL